MPKATPHHKNNGWLINHQQLLIRAYWPLVNYWAPPLGDLWYANVPLKVSSPSCVLLYLRLSSYLTKLKWGISKTIPVPVYIYIHKNIYMHMHTHIYIYNTWWIPHINNNLRVAIWSANTTKIHAMCWRWSHTTLSIYPSVCLPIHLYTILYYLLMSILSVLAI